MTSGEIENAVSEAVLDIARRRSPMLSSVGRSEHLLKNLGLSSLDVAELVATLELKMGFDPFSKNASITAVRTVGDLADVYVKASAS